MVFVLHMGEPSIGYSVGYKEIAEWKEAFVIDLLSLCCSPIVQRHPSRSGTALFIGCD